VEATPYRGSAVTEVLTPRARSDAGRHPRCRRPRAPVRTSAGRAVDWSLDSHGRGGVGRGHGCPMDSRRGRHVDARDRSDRSLVGRGGFTRFDLDGETVLELSWGGARRPHRSRLCDGVRPGSTRLGRRAPTGPAGRRVYRGAQPCLAGGHGAARDAAGWHHPTCRPPRGPDGRAPRRPFRPVPTLNQGPSVTGWRKIVFSLAGWVLRASER
jgi:hypothetical protein